MPNSALFYAVISLIIFLSLRAYCQKVLTRILPSDQLILESTPPSSSPYSSNGPSSRSHGRTVVWCLVQDLDPESDKVESLELFFKSAPLVMTGLDSDSALFEGSFSQLGTPSVPESREDSSAARPPDKFQPGSEFKTEDGADEVTRIKGFPDAQFTGLANGSDQNQRGLSAKSNTSESGSANQKDLQSLDSRDPADRANRLDKLGLMPGSVTVARLDASQSARLGVRHMQRSGVSVRGVISTSNPNLSSLQVAMRRAKCSDCGTYMCVMRYQDYSGNVTEITSSNDFVVAQSVTHRLNVRIRMESLLPQPPPPPPPPPLPSQTVRSSTSFPPSTVDLLCFGTISNPNTPMVWRRLGVNATADLQPHDETPDMVRQGEPRQGQGCQYWRASLLRHTWNGSDQLRRFHCFLSPDEGLSASVLLTKAGPMVTAVCGDPNSTLPTNQDDDVSVTCDVRTLTGVTSVTWQRGDVQVAQCDATLKLGNATTWDCSSSDPRFSVRKEDTKFVLNISRFDVTQDKGRWGCVVIPLLSETSAACILG